MRIQLVTKLLLFSLLFITFSKVYASEREFQQIQDHTKTFGPVKAKDLRAKEIYICKTIQRVMLITEDPKYNTLDWIYTKHYEAIKVIKRNKKTLLEVGACKEDDLSFCRNRMKATIYFRPKISLKERPHLKLKSNSLDLYVSTREENMQSAFDTFTEESSLAEDFLDVFTFGFSAAMELAANLGPGNVIKKITESRRICIP